MKVGDLVSDEPKWFNYDIGVVLKFTNKKKTRVLVAWNENGTQKVPVEDLKVLTEVPDEDR